MAIKIVIEALDDPTSTITHELDQSLITVGRSKSCHIELDHPEISRRHFIVKYEESSYALFDQHSRHGTMVDGVKLEAEKPFVLRDEQVIEVPGFSIRLFCDGERPRLERTTVVARQLLDDLLQGEIRPREMPRLRSRDGRLEFKFAEDKTTFVLGTLPHADFVVSDPSIAKKHVSFIRDIFGIRIVPTSGNLVMLDDTILSDAHLLTAASTIKIGDIEFKFTDSDHHDQSQLEPVPINLTVVDDAQAQAKEALSKTENNFAAIKSAHRSRGVVKTLDRMFVVGIVAVCVGAVMVFAHLN